jgi:hypothetical protein
MRPENFPIGSLESRAAARTHAARSKASRKRVRLVSNAPRPGEDNSRTRFSNCQECKDGSLFQMVYVPHFWLKPGETAPNCPDCGSPFKKTREYPNLIGFEANCVDKHDPERLRREEKADGLAGQCRNLR